MKKKIASISASLIVLAIAGAVIASSYWTQSINNKTSHNLGAVSVSQQYGSAVYTYVPANTTSSAQLASYPTGVVINSYVTTPGTIGYAITSDGARVKVDWTSQLIVITDQTVVY